MSEENGKLVETVMKLLKLPESERNRLLEILRKYKPKQIFLALENCYRLTKHGKLEPTKTLDEFEKILKRTRF